MAQAAPAQAPAEVAATSAVPIVQAPPVPPRRSLVVPATVFFVLIGLTGLLVAAFLLVSLGTGAASIAAFLALIPLGVVLLAIRWIDRWEMEPRVLLLLCFLWGAVTSVFVALVVGFSVEVFQDGLGTTDAARDFYGSVLQAPIAEETAKGFGILLVFLIARRYFDGPVDGVVYAATIAAGFAFTENILYFGAEILDSGTVSSAVIGVFVVRGVMSPFAHVMFTTCTGIAIGIAARRAGAGGGILAFLIGLLPAMGLHALWNGATYVVGEDFLSYYLLVQVPLFIGGVLIVVQLRRAETRVTRERLAEYAAAGWFNLNEVPVLATPAGRRQAMSWARAHGRGAVMKAYITDSTRLAFNRHRIVWSRAYDGALAEEAATLAAIVSRRSALR